MQGNYIQISTVVNEASEDVYFQVGSEDTDDRKVIDMLLDAPSGDEFKVDLVTNGKSLSFQVGAISVSDIAKTYNGVRIRKSA